MNLTYNPKFDFLDGGQAVRVRTSPVEHAGQGGDAGRRMLLYTTTES